MDDHVDMVNKGKQTIKHKVNKCEAIICLMRNISKKIKHLRESAGLTQSDLAQVLDITDVAVSRWEMGVTSPRKKTALKLANYFKVDIEWLQKGVDKSELGLTSIPYYKDVAASAGHGCEITSENITDKISIPRAALGEVTSLKNIICLSIHGDSMDPVIRDKGIVAVDTGYKQIKDGDIYIIIHEGLLRAKVIFKMPLGLRFVSYNSFYSEEFYKFNELNEYSFCVIGRVIWYSSSL